MKTTKYSLIILFLFLQFVNHKNIHVWIIRPLWSNNKVCIYTTVDKLITNHCFLFIMRTAVPLLTILLFNFISTEQSWHPPCIQINNDQFFMKYIYVYRSASFGDVNRLIYTTLTTFVIWQLMNLWWNAIMFLHTKPSNQHLFQSPSNRFPGGKWNPTDFPNKLRYTWPPLFLLQ